jgi:hypothetical protein
LEKTNEIQDKEMNPQNRKREGTNIRIEDQRVQTTPDPKQVNKGQRERGAHGNQGN